jgi:Flp pilus assembly protein TadG
VGRGRQAGQILVMLPFIASMLLLVLAAGIVLGRIAMANADIQRAADAAALAAAANIDVPVWRDQGRLAYTASAYSAAQSQASANASYLRAQGIPVSVTQLWLDPGRQRAYVSVSADIQSLLPSFLPYSGSTARTGVAQTRMERGP